MIKILSEYPEQLRIIQFEPGLGNYHYRYPADGNPPFDLHAVKLVHNEFYKPISLLAVISNLLTPYFGLSTGRHPEL